MKTTTLHWKRMALPVLLVLLLSAVGLTNAMAQTFTVGNLNYSLNDDGVSVTVTGHVDGQNATGELVIPESVEIYGITYPVTVIGGYAFSGCQGLTGSLVIPNSVITIGGCAFLNCFGFNGSLIIGNSVQTIGEEAFVACENLTGSLTISNSVQTICDAAFWGCHGLTGTLTIPLNITSIQSGAFLGCGFVSLDYNAINCNVSDTWPYGGWLVDCENITTLTIGQNVQVIPDSFLEGHTSIIGELIIPNSVTTIGNSAFSGCSGFTGTLVIPETVTSIGENAFNSCSGFTGSLTISNSVTNIGINAFLNCSGFSGTLTLGQSLAEIGNSAFFGACENFTAFSVLPETPPTIGMNAFLSVNTGIPVSVPCGTLNAYQNADGWNSFTNFQEPNPCIWTVTATANPVSGGTVSGAGTYEQGQTCTLTATALGDFEFNRWTENSVTVSTNAVYSFTVENHHNLVAHFINPNFIIFADPTVEARCVELWDTDGDGYLSYNEAAAVTNLDYAFQYWGITSFDELQYFTGLTSLNDYEFYDCESLTSITLPENITYIGYYAFGYCYSLSSIYELSVMPPELNWCAFCDIYSDNNIIISVPCGTTGSYQNVDGWNWFTTYQEPGDCIYEIVATANIEEGGTVNGAGSYQRGQTCTLIATANEGRNFVHWIENSQEVSTDATYSFTVMGPRNLVAVFSALASEIITFADPNVKAICVNHWDTDGDGELTYAEAAAVTNLGGAFSSNQSITSFDELQYFTGLTYINDYEFYYCTNLTSVVIPENVMSIGYEAFLECYNLGGTLTINENVTYIGWGAFYYTNFSTLNYNAVNCEMGGQWLDGATSSLTSLTIGENVQVIPYAAFQDCYNVNGNLIIPNSVTYIGEYAFNNCQSLTSITIPEGITSIEQGTFAYCSSTETINLPSTIENIGYWAFGGCSSLVNIVIPNNVLTIGDRAFEYCSSLTGILELPFATSIGSEAFVDCSSLTGLILSDNIQSIGYYAFKNCSGLRGELTLPESLESVGGYAFYGCDGISTVNYNATNCQTMGSAGEPVFYDCAFEHIRIGENVQSIPNYAFKHCFLVKDIASAAVNPPTIYSSTFGMVSRNIPVSVPMGSGEAYRTAPYWEEFFHITEDYSPNSYTYHWNVNVNQFASNMTVTGIIQIEGVERTVPSLEIGAFCNGECRGRQLLTYYPQVDRYLVFLMLYGEDGDVFTFRLYDHEAGEELTAGCASVITFEADAIVGSFLDPYVFNFTDMQLTQFSEGWNWWSTYVEQAGIDGLSLLQESLGDNGVAIRSQASGYTDYYEGYGWYGSLESINNESSYRVVTSAPCVAAMPGNVAIPSQHPITLSQGWTWIGYLPSRAMDINTALEGLEATQGDMVKSQHGYSEYYPSYGWFGSLNTIEPGMGLMYYSTNGETVTFTYPDSNRGGELKANMTAEHNHWKPNTFAYPDNMTVMAVVELNEMELKSDNYDLAAFAANCECRGSIRLTYAEPLHRHVAFLTISGKDAAELNFRLYDMETGMEYYDAEESLDFVANAIVGEADDLYTIHFRGTTGMDEFASRVQVYPNPVNAGERFSIHVADDVKTPVCVEIVNALGVETLRVTSVQVPAQLTAPATAGVYTLRITVEGKGTVVRKLVVK